MKIETGLDARIEVHAVLDLDRVDMICQVCGGIITDDFYGPHCDCCGWHGCLTVLETMTKAGTHWKRLGYD